MYIDSNDKIHITYINLKDVTLRYSTNTSGSWQTVSSIVSGGEVIDELIETYVVAESGGTVHIFYRREDNQNNSTDNYYLTSSSDSFNTQTLVLDGVSDAKQYRLGNVILDSNDKIHYTYYNSTDGTAFYRTNESGSWVTTEITRDGYTSLSAYDIQVADSTFYFLLLSGSNYFYKTYDGSKWADGNVFTLDGFMRDRFAISTANDRIMVTSENSNDWTISYHTSSIGGYITATDGTSNNSPTISIADESLSYTESGAAIQVASGAAASDADGYTNWDGGKLEVQITANNESADQLTIPDNQVDNINTSGTDLRDDTTVFATLSASEGTITNNTKLTMTFNSNATHDRVSKAAQAVYYENTSADPGTSNRTITFTVTDNNSGSSSDTRTIEVSTIAIPATQATAITFTSVSANQMTINWTNGNGSKRAVFVKQASSGTCAPSDNTTYTANTVFGSGTQVGSTGWYCVFNSDTGSSVTVTGLDSGLTYQVHICEYNGGEGFENYNTTSGASDNPNSQVTPSGTPGLWTGTTDTDWAKGTNWDDSSVPGTEINITVPDVTNQPILDQSRIISDLTLQSSSGLTINEAYTLTASNLEIDDSAVIDITNSGGILVITGTYNKIGTGKIEAKNGGMANIKGNVLKEGTERLLIDTSSDGILIRSSIILP